MRNLESIKRQMVEVQYGGKCYVASDTPFTAKARFLQVIRRHETGAEPGCRSVMGKNVRYAHLVADGKETNRNFLSEEIFEYAKMRTSPPKPYETIRVDRLFCNFLSSQPMAFNLFYPLMKMVELDVHNQKVLADIVKALAKGSGVERIDKITEVGIEYIPHYWEECLHDLTAMDAFFRYSTLDGGRGIIAIETKYTDSFGFNEAKNVVPAIDVANRIADIFKPEALADINSRQTKLTQIYRNFLLTESVRMYEGLADSLSLVISPSGNTVNDVLEKNFTQLLRDEFQYKFQTITLEDFVMALKQAFPEEEIFESFYKRYLEFDLVDLYRR